MKRFQAGWWVYEFTRSTLQHLHNSWNGWLCRIIVFVFVVVVRTIVRVLGI